jgi:predicted ester cyclase
MCGMVRNVDLVISYLQGKFGQTSASIFDKILTPGYVEHEDSATRGAKEAKELALKLAEAFSDQSFEVKDEISEGDRAVVRYKWRGIQAGRFMSWDASNKEITSHGIIIARIEGNRLAELWEEWDFAGFRSQIESA